MHKDGGQHHAADRPGGKGRLGPKAAAGALAAVALAVPTMSWATQADTSP